jgi:flagellar biosynthesis chaperone FliJ
VEEKDLKEFKKTMEEDLKKMLQSNAPVVKIKGDQIIQDQISQLTDRISKLKSVVESQNMVINNIIDHLSIGEETPEPKETYQ